jgi:hypothetical protein
LTHINLYYIRAAIEQATGVTGLSLERVRELLIEEKLISKAEAYKYATIFQGYDEFYQILTTENDPDIEELFDQTWR